MFSPIRLLLSSSSHSKRFQCLFGYESVMTGFYCCEGVPHADPSSSLMLTAAPLSLAHLFASRLFIAFTVWCCSNPATCAPTIFRWCTSQGRNRWWPACCWIRHSPPSPPPTHHRRVEVIYWRRFFDKQNVSRTHQWKTELICHRIHFLR